MQMKATIMAKGGLVDGRAPEVIKRDLTAAMHEAVALLERKVKDKTPQGVYGTQGGLRATIHGEAIQHGTSIRGIVGHQSKYGDVIEKGRRPGQKMPPPGVLLRWIELKTGLSGNAAKGVEYLIRRKIGVKGFEGTHMFEKALDENMGMLKEIFDKAGFDIVAHLNESGS